MRRVAAVLALFVSHACTCDEVVSGQTQEAELAFGANVAPPLPILEVSLGAVAMQTPTTVTFELRSVGNLALAVVSVVLTTDPELCPALSNDFALASGAQSGLVDAGGSRDLVVSFTPTTGSAGCAVLAVATEDSSHPVLRAVLRGQGDASALCTEDTVIDFGDVLVGTTADDVLTLRSCGTRPLQIVGLDGVSGLPPFSFDTLAPVTLAPNETVDVPVHFAPTTSGRHSVAGGNAGVISVVTDQIGQSYIITLEGNGVAPPACDIDVTPALVNFGFVPAEESADVALAVRNIGALPCTVSALSLADGADEFSFTAPAFMAGMILDPLAALDVVVTFDAPAIEGTATNTLVVASDDPNEPLREVPLQAQVPPDTGCFVIATPSFVDFGAVPLNTLRAREVVVENISDEPCFITDTAIQAGSDPGFIDTSSDFGLITPGNTRAFTVGFRPTAEGDADGVFEIEVSDSVFGGTTTVLEIPLSAFTGASGICVVPTIIDFGNTSSTEERTFTVSACGVSTVTVDGIAFSEADAEIALDDLPAFPRVLAPGDAFPVTVRYTPVDGVGDTAVAVVSSDDLVSPSVSVSITGGHSIVPVEAGRYLYYWQIPGGVQGGDVMKAPLQGDTTPGSFWGPRSGKACAGCHSVSPDGKYVAVIEVGFMRFVEADTNLELFLGGTELLDPTSFSWKPNISTTPPYQYAYSDGADIRIGSLFDGEMGLLTGANDGALIETMPTWGPDGTIAFVRGATAATTTDGSFGLVGPTDIMLVSESGGAPVPLEGAAQNGMANYYPAYSPNGLWIAFTQSPSAASTIAATDARLRLAAADNTNSILSMPNVNSPSGPSSYTTWSVDGTFLSFSSQRTGGLGSWDIYLAPMDPLTGADGAAVNLAEVNSADFEHAAQWSP